VQNSKKKGGDFCKPFAPVLKKALEYMARNPDDKMKRSILRILRIWEERAVYDIPLIKDFESSYRKMWDDLNVSV
jgi:regulator of Ty1 transposition protein 103